MHNSAARPLERARTAAFQSLLVSIIKITANSGKAPLWLLKVISEYTVSPAE